MTGIFIQELNQALMLCMLFTGLLILPALCVGLVISILQAATQINEQTLSFVPRLFITFMVLLIFAPWMIDSLVDYFETILTQSILESA